MFQWTKRFKEGHESVEGDLCEGAPVTTMIKCDLHQSIGALCDELNINKETVRKVSHEYLNMGKICAKMVRKIAKIDLPVFVVPYSERWQRLKETGNYWR